MYLQNSLFVLGCVALIYQAAFAIRRRRRAQEGWEDLIFRLQNLQSFRVQQESQAAGEIERAVLANISGLRDVWDLQKRMTLMGDLAVLAESWAGDVGKILAQLIRQDVRDLRKATLAYCIESLWIGHQKATTRFVHTAARSYIDARTRVLALYGQHGALRFAELAQAL